MEERKKTRTEERQALLDRAHVNAERTRKLAEKAQAELDRKRQERESA